MLHKPLSLNNLSLIFSDKPCFEDFSAVIQPGSKIAIMGRNGSGKSSLLKILAGQLENFEGDVAWTGDELVGYVPQTISTYDSLSGGERFQQKLTEALQLGPNILLLDEPTNHLDKQARQSLFQMLSYFYGTYLIVTHDVEVLRNHVDQIWHLQDGQIFIFNGNYDDYLHELTSQQNALHDRSKQLSKERKKAHQNLMKLQKSSKNRRAYGEKKYDDDKLLLRARQASGQSTVNKNKKHLADKREAISNELSSIRFAEELKPKFSISANQTKSSLLTISDGEVGYAKPLIKSMSLSLSGQDRVALQGRNGSGKSTLIKAILGDELVVKSGDWYLPQQKDIGYLDQHYQSLQPDLTVLDSLTSLNLGWSHQEVRKHLNDFLFRKNEEVEKQVSSLSSGEKARLSLAVIAAKTPKILLLDEVTNNLDLETKEHVIQVLNAYPGALIVISHEQDFLDQININATYVIERDLLRLI